MGVGNESWASPHSFGSSKAIYIENNEIKSLLVTDGWRGARYVIRYNDIETKVVPVQNLVQKAVLLGELLVWKLITIM